MDSLDNFKNWYLKIPKRKYHFNHLIKNKIEYSTHLKGRIILTITISREYGLKQLKAYKEID